jgi:hypothetical protein
MPVPDLQCFEGNGCGDVAGYIGNGDLGDFFTVHFEDETFDVHVCDSRGNDTSSNAMRPSIHGHDQDRMRFGTCKFVRGIPQGTRGTTREWELGAMETDARIGDRVIWRQAYPSRPRALARYVVGRGGRRNIRREQAHAA